MKKKERQALGRYLRDVADVMELRDWTVSVAHEPCETHLEAQASCTYGQKYLVVSFGNEFRGREPEEQRETVVHELIHAHLDVCWKMVQTDLAEALGKPVYYVFCDSYRRSMEYAVDGLAKAIAKHLPVIDWG